MGPGRVARDVRDGVYRPAACSRGVALMLGAAGRLARGGHAGRQLGGVRAELHGVHMHGFLTQTTGIRSGAA